MRAEAVDVSAEADVVLAAWSARFGMPAVLAGDAATLCAAQTAPTVDVRHATAPLAGLLGRWAVGRAAEGAAIHPAAIQPIYVRRPDAELARDRALDSSGAAGGRSA